METWGELFWDAWIRFRLWCRSLRRMYWPPRIEAWQVCTFTGVAAIVLTVLSLRHPPVSTSNSDQSTAEKSTSKSAAALSSTKNSPKKLPTVPTVDPYQQAKVVEEATPVEDEIKLEGTDSNAVPAEPQLDSEFADIGPSRPPKADLRQASRPNKLNTTLDSIPPSGAGVADFTPEIDSKAELDPKSESAADSEALASKLSTRPKSVHTLGKMDPLTGKRIPIDENELPIDTEEVSSPPKTNSRAAKSQKSDPQETEQSLSDGKPELESTFVDQPAEQSPLPTTPSKVLPTRKSGHYSREHHEHEETGIADVPVARRKEIEATAPVPAPLVVIRKRGHYTSFSEDKEHDSRVNSDENPSLKVGSDVPGNDPPISQATEEDAALSQLPPPAKRNVPAVPMNDADAFEEPKVGTVPSPQEGTPAERPSTERPRKELPLPEPEVDAMPENSQAEADLDQEARPPILIASEGDESQDVQVDLPRRSVAPPRTSAKSDSDVALEDEVDAPKPARRPVVQVPAVDKTDDQEQAATETETTPPTRKFHGPVLSTDSVDHEAHVSEDKFNGGVRKQRGIPDLHPSKPSQFHGPVLSTKAADHDAHIDEDSISGGNSTTHDPSPIRQAPKAKVIKPTQEHQTRQPVSTPAPEIEKTNAETNRVPAETEYEPSEASPNAGKSKETTVPVKPDTEAPLTDAIDTATPPTVRRITPRSGRNAESETEDESPPAVPTPPVQPRTTPRNAAPDFGQDEETAAPPMVPARKQKDDIVSPAVTPDLTQPRISSRISVPQRIPMPDELPAPTPRTRASTVPNTVPIPQKESGSTLPRISKPAAPQSIPRTTAAPRLEMEITGPRKAPVGTQIVLHFKIKNVGNAPATGIMVSDVLPPGLQHRLSPDLEYAIPRLAPGESRETNLTVICTATGVITNRAVLNADGDVTAEASFQVEVTSSTVGATSNTTVSRAPITVSHRGPERWLVDSTGQFLVTVTNTSGQVLRDVTITETFPADTKLIHATVGHKADAENRTVCWTISEFVPGAAYILETELHSIKSGPQSTTVKVKIGGTDVAEDRWTAVSYSDGTLLR